MNEASKTASPAKTHRNTKKPYYRTIDWRQERPKLFDLLVELETAERIGAQQQCIVIWRNDTPFVLTNSNLARNAANLARYMKAGTIPADLVRDAQNGKDVKLTLDGKAIAELFSAAGMVINWDDLTIDVAELDNVLDSPPPTNRTRLYDLVSSLSDDEITPALTALRAMRMK